MMVFLGLLQVFPLSATLFNIYALFIVPDIPDIPEVESVFLADDIVVNSDHRNLAYATFRTQCAVYQLAPQAFALNLSVSTSKSVTMVFSLRPCKFNDAI